VVVGRGQDSGLFIPDAQVSRKHAKVFRQGSSYWICDLGSHNGTVVNEVRTEGNQLLCDGDVVLLGSTLLSVTLDESGRKEMGAIRIEHDPAQLSMTVERSVAELAPPPIERIRDLDSTADGRLQVISTSGKTTERDMALILANARRFGILFHMARSMQEATVPEKLLTNMMEYLFKVLDIDRGDVVLVGDDQALFPVISMDRQGNYSQTVRLSRTVLSRVIDSRMAVISTDARTDPRLSASDSILMYGMRSLMCVPMISKDRLVGVVQVSNERNISAFLEEDLYLLTVFASLAAVSVENARLYERQQMALEDARRAQEELLRTQEELVQRERLASVGQMASGIAHEVRNTLGPMSLLHLIRERYPDDDVLAQYTDLMNEAHKRIITIVDEVRDFSKGQQPTLHGGLQSLRLLVDSVLRFMKYDKTVRPGSIQVEILEEASAFFHSDRMKQVLINLVRNAAQALPAEGGSICIRVSKDAEFARLEVMDNGKGIPIEDLDQIWVPFFSTKGESGTGLGLHISQVIVHQHGGRIECISEVGTGTVMTVFLPLTEAVAVAERARREEEERHAKLQAGFPAEGTPMNLSRVEHTQRHKTDGTENRPDIGMRELTR
jgi:signal transduction histidine kinase